MKHFKCVILYLSRRRKEKCCVILYGLKKVFQNNKADFTTYTMPCCNNINNTAPVGRYKNTIIAVNLNCTIVVTIDKIYVHLYRRGVYIRWHILLTYLKSIVAYVVALL